MARFNTSGLDDIINQMRALGQDTGPVAEEMVVASVEAIREEWRKSAEAHGHIDSGDMIASITYSPSTTVMGSIKSRDVYPQGNDHKGVSNATKAFVLHYGKSTKAGSHWVDDADDNSSAPVQAVCEEIWDNYLQSHQ